MDNTGLMELIFRAIAGLPLIRINGITMERSRKSIIPIMFHLHLTIGIMIEMVS
ncbi:MAG: hypothetical protein PH343_07835 [Nitrospira sp.]|nr:hypothetical protein [Nitrospira sp.]